MICPLLIFNKLARNLSYGFEGRHRLFDLLPTHIMSKRKHSDNFEEGSLGPKQHRSSPHSPSKRTHTDNYREGRPEYKQHTSSQDSPSKRTHIDNYGEKRPGPNQQRSSQNTPSTSQNSPNKSRPRKRQKDGPPTTGISLGNFVFFYGPRDIFSQFHPAKFVVDGQEYNCMEQYMHHQKAVTFNDPVRAYQILATDDPVAQKKLGRQVQNFDPSVWGKKSVEVVAKGSEQKYLQNEEMKKALYATYPRDLVEASPRDRLWGIGLGARNPKAQDPSQWRGKNLLGKTLTDVRDKLWEDEIECPEGENKPQREQPKKSKQLLMDQFTKPSSSRGSKR